MTEEFGDFVATLIMIPAAIIALVLFIPTLGHSFRWLGKLARFLQDIGLDSIGYDSSGNGLY